MVFPVVTCGCESWTKKIAEQRRTDASERDAGEDSWDKPVHPKGNQPWIFIRRTDAGAEFPIFWPPDVKNWLICKDLDVGKDWGQEEKGTTEDETVGGHHRLDGNEFEQAPGVGDGQGGLACWSPRGHKESDKTEQLNNMKSYLRPRIVLRPNLED